MTAPRITDIVTAQGKNSTTFVIWYKAPRGRKEYTLMASGRNKATAQDITALTKQYGSICQAISKLNLDIIECDNWNSLV